MSIVLRDIQKDDLELIMKWRMSEDVTKYMNTNPKLSLEDQLKWFESIKSNQDVRYWMILVNGEAAGVINLTGLTRKDGNLGWAYYIGEKRLRGIKTALALEMNLYDFALISLGKKSVYSDVFSLNTGVIQLHKLCGCEILGVRKNAVIKEGIAYDVTDMIMTAEKWKQLRVEKKYEKIEWSL